MQTAGNRKAYDASSPGNMLEMLSCTLYQPVDMETEEAVV